MSVGGSVGVAEFVEVIGAEEFFCVGFRVPACFGKEAGGDEYELGVVGVLAREQVVVGVAFVCTFESEGDSDEPAYGSFAGHAKGVAEYCAEEASFVFVQHVLFYWGEGG